MNSTIAAPSGCFSTTAIRSYAWAVSAQYNPGEHCRRTIVHPRRLPDGLLEVTFAGQAAPDLFLIEIATYAERRVPDQMADDIALVLLERRMLPELLTVVLHTRGNARVGDSYELRSRLGWTRLAVAWRVVELWNVPAEQLLAANDIGLIPWVPLAQFSDPPAVMLQE